MTGKMVFEELVCTNNEHKIGVATLDNTTSLNALTFDMLQQLNDQLLMWQKDDHIVTVLLEGAGEKAFCAGGDVRAMYHAMNDGTADESQRFCTDYFALEYQCDYLIHTYSKPIIAWGDGIVMGGGIGLYIGTSHRIVTPTSRLAMPEISIGLYPDVGGTWFLNQLAPGIGLFLGLTGASINASDAVHLDLADHFLMVEQKQALIEHLTGCLWHTVNDKFVAVTELLDDLEQQRSGPLPPSQIVPYFVQIQAACNSSDLNSICKNILAIEGMGLWIERAKKTLAEGSPISAHICFRQVTQYQSHELADCFRLELNLSAKCCSLGEFQEGVRARLIDKTGEPAWLFKTINGVDEQVIDDLFTSLWPDEQHPLAQLGK
ncbi:enoyl-CoA hydratase/isomerase family protein [Aliivibrio kagoshimensis]|uniref:enoyl-CoA hydratase/isomerase family protein n=1 Tax=Aliivibrio kagoshimensis TaxID=2910230 RepID=UPI003D12F7C3